MQEELLPRDHGPGSFRDESKKRRQTPTLTSDSCVHVFCCRLTVIPGSFLAVDTFFLVSGFLLSSLLLPKLDSGLLGDGSSFAWITKAYAHRYLRLTPTLAFVTLMFWKVLPLLGEGASFWAVGSAVEERCSR